MCYSVESSAKTTLLSLTCIAILLHSKNPHFQWMGFILIGWCIMQFAELLLWTTNPRKGCTEANKLITLFIIPIVLALQPLGSLLGSMLIKPWSVCTKERKTFLVVTTACILFATYIIYYRNAIKNCTTVTPGGHLHWILNDNADYATNGNWKMFIWAFIILFPIVTLWDASYKIIILISVIPYLAYKKGAVTDSHASLWCYYTSFTSVVSVLFYGLYKLKIYNILA